MQENAADGMGRPFRSSYYLPGSPPLILPVRWYQGHPLAQQEKGRK
jgi:hypothetical protein